jgi:hypothetical protein
MTEAIARRAGVVIPCAHMWPGRGRHAGHTHQCVKPENHTAVVCQCSCGTRARRADDRSSICIRLPADLRDRLAAAAAEREVSMNWIAKHAIVDYLDRLIPVDEIKWTR